MQTIEQWEAEAMRLADEYGRLKWDEGIADGGFDALGRRRFREEAQETLAALSAHLASHPGRQEGEDAKRLDWLSSDCCTSVFKLGSNWYTRTDYGMPHHKAKSLRAAVDAAMAKEPTHD